MICGSYILFPPCNWIQDLYTKPTLKSRSDTSYNFLIKQHPFDLLDWIHLQVSKMLGICFSVFITVSRTRTYTVNVENMPYILFSACFINVAILQCWMRVAVIIALYLRGTSWGELKWKCSQQIIHDLNIIPFSFISDNIFYTVLETKVERYIAISKHYNLLSHSAGLSNKEILFVQICPFLVYW